VAVARLGSAPGGLTEQDAARRLALTGPNAVRSHRARPATALASQFRSPLLVLLAVATVASLATGERGSALAIGVILLVSIGLGFASEYRAEKAAEALHSGGQHRCVVRRGGQPRSAGVAELVPGDIIALRLGQLVPADVRLLAAADLECEESVLAGEPARARKSADPVPPGVPLAELSCCALMGTVVSSGSGTGVVVATGGRTRFGRAAAGLGKQPQTELQAGLRRFSLLLAEAAGVLATVIFVLNVALHRPITGALLFALAIAVGVVPQLLPAVVSASLAAGSRRLARSGVLVRRLACIEDLADIDVLFTDKTGTLTDGRLRFMRSAGPDGRAADEPLLLGLLCSEAVVADDGRVVSGSPLDTALWDSPAAARHKPVLAGYQRVATLPFDHHRRASSVLVAAADGSRMIVSKGAPENLLERCASVPAAARAALDAEFAAGNRVVAVATRPAPGQWVLTPDDERDLQLRGLLVFLDAAADGARSALRRLAGLGITVKVLTGDNPAVAARVCADLGLPAGQVATGADIDAAGDRLAELLARSTVFARLSPEHKAQVVRAQRRAGPGVAFLGDGVSDAVALHAADVGISVGSGADVARDAADVLLRDKDLDVLADGVAEGRRIFASTMKYTLMGTSGNAGNLVSAAAASLFLAFLPLLPAQILLRNLLYDTGQLASRTDDADPEQLARPSRWDARLIRRFMLLFGPVSVLFDLVTFGVLLWVFHAAAPVFRTGWFVESLAAQALVIFALRTRRVPFFRSRPSVPLLLAALGAAGAGLLLPATPLAHALGFQPLPGGFYLALAAIVAGYLGITELAKRWFYRATRTGPAAPEPRRRLSGYRIRRRAARFTSGASVAGVPVPAQPAGAAARAWLARLTARARRTGGARAPREGPAGSSGPPRPGAARTPRDGSTARLALPPGPLPPQQASGRGPGQRREPGPWAGEQPEPDPLTERHSVPRPWGAPHPGSGQAMAPPPGFGQPPPEPWASPPAPEPWAARQPAPGPLTGAYPVQSWPGQQPPPQSGPQPRVPRARPPQPLPSYPATPPAGTERPEHGRARNPRHGRGRRAIPGGQPRGWPGRDDTGPDRRPQSG
jgi:Mg2+-importing ATPase